MAARVSALELAHAFAEIAVRRFHQQMIVIAHQAVGVRNPIEVLDHRAKCFKEGATILVVLIDRLATITAGGDMVKRPGKLESQRSGHLESIA